MHEEIVVNIVANAFNGLGEYSGSDDFGYSFAGIDLLEFMENYVGEPRDSDDLSAEFMAYTGTRYVIAYIDADGSRSVVGYATHADQLAAFIELENEFMAFEDALEDEV